VKKEDIRRLWPIASRKIAAEETDETVGTNGGQGDSTSGGAAGTGSSTTGSAGGNGEWTSTGNNGNKEYYPLPAEPPPARQRVVVAAYATLLARYPDRRVPKISIEELANILRKSGKPLLDRDSIRRALKLRT
jgi:hypothetical protein